MTHRSAFAEQADTYARLAAAAQDADERQVLLSIEKTFRNFAEADRRITKVRERNPSIFARRDPPPRHAPPPVPRPRHDDNLRDAHRDSTLRSRPLPAVLRPETV